MNKVITPEQAAEALEASIAHWYRLATGTRNENEEMYGSDCALCRLYRSKNDCGECPVKVETGESHCSDGPWMTVHYSMQRMLYYFDQDKVQAYNSQEFKDAAMKMLVFLESLRKPTV